MKKGIVTEILKNKKVKVNNILFVPESDRAVLDPRVKEGDQAFLLVGEDRGLTKSYKIISTEEIVETPPMSDKEITERRITFLSALGHAVKYIGKSSPGSAPEEILSVARQFADAAIQYSTNTEVQS